MKKRCFQPLQLGPPAAALLACLFSPSDGSLRLIFFSGVLRLCSLGAPQCLRRSAFRLVSAQKVIFSTLFALILTAAACLLLLQCSPSLTRLLSRWSPLFANLTGKELCLWVICGGEITLIQCIEEQFYAENDLQSAQITDLLCGLAIFCGLCLHPESPFQAKNCVLCLTVLIMILLPTAFLLETRPKPIPAAMCLREAPVAILQLCLYPGLGFALFPGKGILLGYALLECIRTAFRRSPGENPFLLRCLIPVAILFSGCPAVLLACACGLLLYAAPSPRSIIAELTLLFGLFCPLSALLCYLLFLCLLPDIAQKIRYIE